MKTRMLLLTLLSSFILLPCSLVVSQAGVVFTNLYSFSGNDGANPQAALVQGSDGYFYGTTYAGGTNNPVCTVFKITSNGALTSLYSFSGNDGANPSAGLMQCSDGNFYGTSTNGGAQDNGTVFKISTNGALISLYSFTNCDDGVNPQAALVQGSDGYFLWHDVRRHELRWHRIQNQHQRGAQYFV
jgi:uncharacterized repeat protein (TIGR03803 family)